ncbi:MAG TPA: hypothetical protein DCZ12_04640, partial [Gammaproteobacteria bacterium]|nr:hypothetical protein [Gammaproteobacteria bacterium]
WPSVDAREPKPIPPKSRGKEVYVTERRIVSRRGLGHTITSPAAAIRVTENHGNAIYLLSNANDLVGVAPMSDAEMKTLREGGRVNRLLSAINTTNAGAAIIRANDREAADNVARFFGRFGGPEPLRVLDSIVGPKGEAESLAESGCSAPSGSSVFYSRGADPATATEGRPAEALNSAMAKHLGDDWAGAYVEADLNEVAPGMAEAVQVAFGTEVQGIAPTNEEFNGFRGIYNPAEPGKIYINSQGRTGMIHVAGHELLHELKRSRPDLYEYLVSNARQHFVDFAEYNDKLQALLKPGEESLSITEVEEELIADFMGDSLADPRFLSVLAKDNPGKFRRLLKVVTDWLAGIADKVRNLGSTAHLDDIEAMRGYLRKVINAHASGKPIGDIDPPALGDKPVFSRSANPTGFSAPDETLVSIALRRFQDKFKVLKDIQASIKEAGGTITDESNPYQAETLFHGKTEDDLRYIRDTYIEPLARVMDKNSIEQDELDEYLTASHAEERYDHIASINPSMPDGGSGMTTKDANAALNKFRDSGKHEALEEAAQIVYDMLQHQRDTIKSGGL